MDMSRIASGQAQPMAGRGKAVAADAPPRPARAGTADSATAATPVAGGLDPADNAKATREHLQQLLEQVSRHIDPERRSLSFEVSDEMGPAVVSVYDAETEELIRQIPSETLLRIAAAMREIALQGGAGLAAPGLLLREQA